MGLFSNFFLPQSAKAMLASVNVIHDEIKRTCNLSIFGGHQAVDLLKERIDAMIKCNTQSVEKALAEGNITPMQLAWSTFLKESRSEVLSGAYNEEGRHALYRTHCKSLLELQKSGFFTEQQIKDMKLNLDKELFS